MTSENRALCSMGKGFRSPARDNPMGGSLKERRSIHGAGFVTENIRREKEPLQIPELNTGFDVPYWYGGQDLTRISQDVYGCYADSREITRRVDAEPERLVPLCFKADVEEPGNYQVEP